MSKVEKYMRVMLTAIWAALGILAFLAILKFKYSWNMGWADFLFGLGIVFLLGTTAALIYKPLKMYNLKSNQP